MSEGGGRSILVAGGTGTIGRAIVAHATSRGFRCFTLSRRAQASRADCHHLRGDITERGSLRVAFQRLRRASPLIWGVVNCVGCNLLRPAQDYTPSEIQRLLAVNLKGPILLAQFAIPLLKTTRGKLLQIASQAGLSPQPHNTVYSAAKAGLIAFGHGLAMELAPSAVSVITLCPGDISSPMMDRAMLRLVSPSPTSLAAARRRFAERLPSRRLGTPEEVAQAVVQLLSIESSFLTGAAVVMAGARTCH